MSIEDIPDFPEQPEFNLDTFLDSIQFKAYFKPSKREIEMLRKLDDEMTDIKVNDMQKDKYYFKRYV